MRKKSKLVVSLLIYCCHFANANIFDTVTNYYCDLFECCNEKTVPYELKSLRTMLNTKLYGQHIAAEVVLNAINSHVKKTNPNKPLLMSFHGSNGVGKSYVSRMIATAFYKNRENSRYFHFYYGLEDFPISGQNQREITQYQEQLKSNIQTAIHNCERSIFIFDGVDYMPANLLDVLMPFVDCKQCGNKIKKNRSIFIFLANKGSQAIMKKLLEKTRDGIKRESLGLKDFETTISTEVINADGPFYKSKLIESHAIDFYVPFLPLEKMHVEKCIKDAFKEVNFTPTKNLIDLTFQELTFSPEPENLFSNSGCKRVEQIVGRLNAKYNPLFDDEL